MRTCLGIIVLGLVASLARCSKGPASNLLKVTVSTKGEITADGQPVTLEQLSAKMDELQKVEGGAVLYYRENPHQRRPHPNAEKVIQLVIDHQLPIKLCTKPDFSE